MGKLVFRIVWGDEIAGPNPATLTINQWSKSPPLDCGLALEIPRK